MTLFKRITVVSIAIVAVAALVAIPTQKAEATGQVTICLNGQTTQISAIQFLFLWWVYLLQGATLGECAPPAPDPTPTPTPSATPDTNASPDPTPVPTATPSSDPSPAATSTPRVSPTPMGNDHPDDCTEGPDGPTAGVTIQITALGITIEFTGTGQGTADFTVLNGDTFSGYVWVKGGPIHNPNGFFDAVTSGSVSAAVNDSNPNGNLYDISHLDVCPEPTPTPSETPSETPTPDTNASPDPSPTPSEEPSPSPSPSEEPSPTPTPDTNASPDPSPTPDTNVSPDPTPDVNASPDPSPSGPGQQASPDPSDDPGALASPDPGGSSTTSGGSGTGVAPSTFANTSEPLSLQQLLITLGLLSLAAGLILIGQKRRA